MKNNIDIDKYMKDYNESLPPVSHTKEEENSLFNSILMKSQLEKSAGHKTHSNSKYSIFLDYINSLFQKNSFRYSIGFATIFMFIGVWVLFKFTAKDNYIASNNVIKNEIKHDHNIPEQETIIPINRVDTTLLASIDIDSYSRGSENTLDKKTVFAIIGKQLQKNNVQYQVGAVLTTQKIQTDSGTVILMFTYNLSNRSVGVVGISRAMDKEKGVQITIKPLIKKIETTLQHKVRMLYE